MGIVFALSPLCGAVEVDKAGSLSVVDTGASVAVEDAPEVKVEDYEMKRLVGQPSKGFIVVS